MFDKQQDNSNKRYTTCCIWIIAGNDGMRIDIYKWGAGGSGVCVDKLFGDKAHQYWLIGTPPHA